MIPERKPRLQENIMDAQYRLLQIRLMAAQKKQGMSQHDQAVSWDEGGLGAHFAQCRDEIAAAAAAGEDDEKLWALFWRLKQERNTAT